MTALQKSDAQTGQPLPVITMAVLLTVSVATYVVGVVGVVSGVLV